MIFATIHDQSSLKALKEAGCDGIIIGVVYLALHCPCMVELDEIAQWKESCDQLGLDLYVNGTKMMMDEDLPLVLKTLQRCQSLGIQGFYFADEGVLQLAKEIGYQQALIYQPETLITNHLDAQFYLNQGIQAVSLAHELSLEEIKKIVQTPHLEVLINGYFSILYSRRPLISNYMHQENIEVPSTLQYDLIEATRTDRMPILQDETGTHIFSEQPIQSYNEIQALKECGISRFRIDSIFQSDAWTIDILKAYKEHLVMPGSDHWYHQQTIRKKEEQK